MYIHLMLVGLKMVRQRWAGFLFLIGLTLSPALGQVSEERDGESVQSSSEERPQGGTPELSRVAELIVEKTNGFRRDEGLKPVETNAELKKTVQYFADFMAQTDKYGHNADGKGHAQRAENHGYEYCMVSENIAYQYSSTGFETEELAQKFFEGWKNSPEHRENMLDPDATQTAVAVAQSEKTGHFYGVQMFGRPRSAQIQFQIENRSGSDVRYQIGDRSFPLPPRFTRTHQRCRAIKLTFSFSGDEQQSDASQQPASRKQQSETFEPGDGDHFIITEQDGELKVKRQ